MIKMNIINATIDWFSLKLGVGSLTICAISGKPWVVGVGVAAALSTLVYNGIRIYKELKKSK